MPPLELNFAPSPDVAALVGALLDRLERRAPDAAQQPVRAVKMSLTEMALPAYASQMDPEPRQVANEQLLALEKAGLLRLFWQAGEAGHLLSAAALVSGAEAPLYALLRRTSTHRLRSRLEEQLLGCRFRFNPLHWQYRAIQSILASLKEHKSPAPFSLTDSAFNEDVLLAITALVQLAEETPFREFSVRTFNDSKRFEELKPAVVRLARLGQAGWKRLPADELLRELNLVANPSYLLLAGPWTLVDAAGQVLTLAEFQPSLGLAAVQAAHLQRVSVRAARVVCVENLTTFHTLAASLARAAHQPPAALLCLAGNPSPACRHLLRCLVETLPEALPLQVWADLDYGGLNILAQLRKEVSPRCMPEHMDADTLERFAQFARPLSPTDRRNLERQQRRAELSDLSPVIGAMLRRGVKLEQEAIQL